MPYYKDKDDDIREVSELLKEYKNDLSDLKTVADKEGYIESNEEQLEKLNYDFDNDEK